MLCDGVTVEISRVCTVGHKNACSMLYGAMMRAAKSLGYTRVVTYTLSRESGASPKSCGFVESAMCKPEDWGRRRQSAVGFQPSMFFEKYGEPEERIRWEKRI